MIVSERIHQRLLIDNRAAGAIDEIGPFFHSGYGLSVEQMLGLWPKRHMNRKVIRFSQQSLERNELHGKISAAGFRKHGVVHQNLFHQWLNHSRREPPNPSKA